MASQILAQSHQSTPALPGTWKLGAGRAVTLQPREPGVLRIAHGSVWVTGDGPHAGPLNDQGDRFLHSGEQVWLRTGERMVIEATDKQASAYFSWDPLPETEAPRIQAAALLQPLEDLRLAVVLGAGAVVRLVAALAGFAFGVVARERGALAQCARNAHSSARRPHGAMS